MKKAFRDAYNRELALLYERSSEFAQDYPGIADRLGGLLKNNLDPAVAGLLEGTAFLAARVQLKMDEEFRTFSTELLEQVFPDALAPTPSAMLVQAKPPYDNKDLANGVLLKKDDYLDARFVDADKRVACRFRLCNDLKLLPLDITNVIYFDGPAGLANLGQDVFPGVKAGMAIDLARISTKGKPGGAGPLSEVSVDDLTMHFTSNLAEATQLYEHVNCNLTRVSLRYLNANGDPVFVRMPSACVTQIGFSADESLLPHSKRLFEGFAMLREAFIFPQKFLGMQITGLGDALNRIPADTVKLVFEFDSVNPTLASRLEADDIKLHCAPAVNLFEETASQVRLDKKRHEFVVTPDSSPVTHYEIYQLQKVYAHYSGNQAKVDVYPLYGLPPDGTDPRRALYFTTGRKQRRLTDKERRFGMSRYRYRGTETFISIYEPPNTEPAQRLQIQALCTNRHLTEYLPIAQSKNDFYMSNDVAISLGCVSGPTTPREAMTEIERDLGHRTTAGDNYWRLISYLSLNQHGLGGTNSEDGAPRLRELLSLFADLSNSITMTQLGGIKSVETRPIVRTVKRDGSFHPARGIEVKLTFDEDDFEGSNVMLLGAILDRFFAEYASINSFTQCVIASVQRGILKTFEPRTGQGPLL